MFFKRTNCPNCNSRFDEMLDYCPFCGIRNEEHSDFKRRHPMTFLPWYLELVLALTGLIGFSLLNIIFSLLLRSTYQDDAGYGLMLINTLSYLAFFLIIFVIIFTRSGYRRDILSKFKIPTAYMWAGIGFAALLAFSYTYGIIIQVFFPDIGEGGNQSAVVDMVTRYPLISILIVGIIGPICEEVAYRVGLFTLLRRVHPSVAYIGTALIFGFIHFDFTSTDLVTEIVYLQEYMFAGLCFSFVYEKKGFAASTLAHISNNMLSIVMIVLQSQLLQ